MEFTTLGFIYLLLPVSVTLYYLTPKNYKSIVLLAISAGFFYLESPLFMLISTSNILFDYLCVSTMWRYQHNNSWTKSIFFFATFKNILLTVWFGIIYSFIQHQTPPLGIIITSVSSIWYMLNLYHGRISALDNLVTFGLYCMFFGKLKYGAIPNPRKLLTQIRRPIPSLSSLGEGIQLIIIGVAKRVILADNLFLVIDAITTIPISGITFMSSVTVIISQAMWLQLTFSSFSDIAQGISKVFSLNIGRNVYYPLQAKGIYEYIYRFNMSFVAFLEELLNTGSVDKHGVVSIFKRTAIIMLSALMIVAWISPNISGLLWAFVMTTITFLQFLIPQKIHLPSFIVRIITAIVCILSMILLIGTNSDYMIATITSLFKFLGENIYNDQILHVYSYTYIPIILSVICTTSMVDMFSRFVKDKYPNTHSILSSMYNLAVLIVTTSFMLLGRI